MLEAEDIGTEACRRPEIELTARARLPVPHRQVLLDALLALEPGDCLALAAELLDELEGDALPAAEDTPARDSPDLTIVHVAALRDEALEPVEGVANDLLQRLAGFGARRMERARLGLERRRLDLLDLHAEARQQLRQIRVLEDHADRADERCLAG